MDEQLRQGENTNIYAIFWVTAYLGKVVKIVSSEMLVLFFRLINIYILNTMYGQYWLEHGMGMLHAHFDMEINYLPYNDLALTYMQSLYRVRKVWVQGKRLELLKAIGRPHDTPRDETKKQCTMHGVPSLRTLL